MKYNTKYQATGEGVSLAVKLTLIQIRLARSKVEKIPRPVIKIGMGQDEF